MSNFSDIGRADPVGQINRWQAHDSTMKSQNQNRAVQDLNMTHKRQEIDIRQQKINARIEAEKKADAPIPWEVMELKFEGAGQENSPASFAQKVMIENGLLDTSQGGLGTTSRRKNGEFLKIRGDPQMASKFSRVRVDYGRNQLMQAKTALSNKPDDQKAQLAFKKASDYLTQALGADKQLTDGLKAMDGFTLSPGQRRFDSKNKQVASVPDREIGDSSGAKNLESIKSDYQEAIGRSYSAERGVGAFLNDPNKEKVARDALRQSINIANQYAAQGGDVRDLGTSIEALDEGMQKLDGGGAKELDEETAKKLLKEAGGDADKARALATERGYTF